MDTKDIPKDGPSDWRREPSERRNALIGKLGEELCETAGRCFRAMIQGLDERDPGSGRRNIEHIHDEVADVLAQLRLMDEFIGLDNEAIAYRGEAKANYKRSWIAALPDSR